MGGTDSGIILTNVEVGNTSKPVVTGGRPKSDWYFFLRAGTLACHIEKVVVWLDPTFNPSEYTLTKADAEGTFTTPEVRGWGLFTIHAEIHWKVSSNVTRLDDGLRSPPYKVSHMLELRRPEPRSIDLSRLFLRKATREEAAVAAATAEAEKEAAKREANKTVPGEMYTYLYYHANFGQKAQVEKLLAGGADPSIANTEDGTTPLYMAAQNGHHKIVQVLLAANASPSTAAATHGMTPVYIAAQQGHLDILKTLLIARASPSTPRTIDGATPLRIAEQRGDTACVDLLNHYLSA